MCAMRPAGWAVLGLIFFGTSAAHAQSGKKMVPATRIVPQDPALVAQGARLYGQCAACHGMEAEGRVGIAPSLASSTYLEAASDTMLIETIKKGRAGTTMIAWGAVLNDGQVRAIIAFLRSKTPTEPAQLNESPLKGDAKRGAELFRSICRGCHGNTGAGYQETASGTGIGRKAFLDTVSNGFLRRIIQKGKNGTPMRAFDSNSISAVANLSEQQIEDVIAHLRANAW